MIMIKQNNIFPKSKKKESLEHLKRGNLKNYQIIEGQCKLDCQKEGRQAKVRRLILYDLS